MSDQSSVIETTCAMCGKGDRGIPVPWNAVLASRELNTSDVLVFACQHCKANICAECKKIHLKWSLWSGWDKVQCPRCGQLFGPGEVLFHRSVGGATLASVSSEANSAQLVEAFKKRLNEMKLKPKLPPVPAYVREKTYQAGGKYTPSALALMVGIGLPTAAVIGVIGYYLGSLLPSLVTSVGNFLIELMIGLGSNYFGMAAWVFMIMMGIIIAIGYPALLGVAIGRVTWFLAKRSKCRNPRWAEFLGLLNAIVGYGVFSFIAIQTSEIIHTTSGMVHFGLGETGIMLYAAIVLDTLIFTSTAFRVSGDLVKETPFCEDCEQWYGGWQEEAIFSISLAEPLVQALESGTLQDLENVIRVPKNERPHLVLKIRECRSCKTSDVQLWARLAWEETVTERGEQKTKSKEEDWFQVMVPAALGMQLKKLFD